MKNVSHLGLRARTWSLSHGASGAMGSGQCVTVHPSRSVILTQGQGNFALCADSVFSRSLSSEFNFVEEFCCSHWFRRTRRCLKVTKVSPIPCMPPSLRVRLAAPMSDAWAGKWGHPARQFNERVRQGPAPLQSISVRAQCLTDSSPLPAFLSRPRRKWRLPAN